jgi:hypothetical protein
MWDEIDDSSLLIEKWHWNGANWITDIKEWETFLYGNTGLSFALPHLTLHNYRILDWLFTLSNASNWNASNFVTVSIGRSRTAGGLTIKSNAYTSGSTGNVRKVLEKINQDYDLVNDPGNWFFTQATVTGTASYNYASKLRYQIFR